MRQVNLILESFVDDCKIQMLEENESAPNTHSELEVLKTSKLVQESTREFKALLTSGGMMKEIQESIAAGVQPALAKASRLIQEDFDYNETLQNGKDYLVNKLGGATAENFNNLTNTANESGTALNTLHNTPGVNTVVGANEAANTAGQAISTATAPAIAATKEFVAPAVNAVNSGIADVKTAAAPLVASATNTLESGLKTAQETVKPALTAVQSAIAKGQAAVAPTVEAAQNYEVTPGQANAAIGTAGLVGGAGVANAFRNRYSKK